jgi:hypothetical protein
LLLFFHFKFLIYYIQNFLIQYSYQIYFLGFVVSSADGRF